LKRETKQHFAFRDKRIRGRIDASRRLKTGNILKICIYFFQTNHSSSGGFFQLEFQPLTIRRKRKLKFGRIDENIKAKLPEYTAELAISVN